MKNSKGIELGSRVGDSISGFVGIAYAHAEYMNGCEKILIVPDKLKSDGGIAEDAWFDIQQIVVKKPIAKKKEKLSGGPMNTPPSRS